MNKRTPKTQKAYDKYLENIKKKGIKPFSENEVIATGSIKMKGEEKITYRLTPNKFCYDALGYTKDTHLLLIVIGATDKTMKKVIQRIAELLPEYEVFENPKAKQSVKDIKHIHLLDKSVKQSII
jgi:hypothetical protein